MVKKGKLTEIFSKALYYDDPERYSVSFRDFDSVVRISLPEFLKVSDNFETVPASRILTIEKDGVIQFSKNQNHSKVQKSRKIKKPGKTKLK
jgi:hypothetical protein